MTDVRGQFDDRWDHPGTAAEVTRRIKDAISALPPGQRQATEAYYLSGLTQAETAAWLGIPASAVKTRTRRPAHQPQRLPARKAHAHAH